jgi:hypothetical protein
MNTTIYYKVRTRHAWGNTDWTYQEYLLGDRETWTQAQDELAGEINEKHNWSDKYRGVDFEQVAAPPPDWVTQQIEASQRQIRYARERIHRLRFLQRKLQILGHEADGTALYEGSLPIDQRPHVGETWKTNLDEIVQINSVDPYGRSFTYQRTRDAWVDNQLISVIVSGTINPTDVQNGNYRRVSRKGA